MLLASTGDDTPSKLLMTTVWLSSSRIREVSVSVMVLVREVAETQARSHGATRDANAQLHELPCNSFQFGLGVLHVCL